MGKAVAIPPLCDGDCMDADEFLCRYAADPVAYSAEFLREVVYITRQREVCNRREVIVPFLRADHGVARAALSGFIGFYSAHTPGTTGSVSATTVFASQTTALEPDVVLCMNPECGGRSIIKSGYFRHGTPELLAEISFTSGSRDFGKKFDTYQAEGVPEYLVWRTAEQEVHWFALKRKKYAALEPHADGTLRSETFPGLWLDVPALLAGDLARVLATLQQGIGSPEHAAFVAKLAKAAKKKKK